MIAIYCYLLLFTQSFAVIVSGERLTTRLRVLTFKAMMQKNIAWFDKEENTTGSLSTMLSLDAKNVKAVSRAFLKCVNDHNFILL